MLQKTVVEKIKTIVFVQLLFIEKRAVYEIKWKNFVERGRLQMILWRMRIACWIPKATITHTKVV